jgi:hypothetical protein
VLSLGVGAAWTVPSVRAPTSTLRMMGCIFLREKVFGLGKIWKSLDIGTRSMRVKVSLMMDFLRLLPKSFILSSLRGYAPRSLDLSYENEIHSSITHGLVPIMHALRPPEILVLTVLESKHSRG